MAKRKKKNNNRLIIILVVVIAGLAALAAWKAKSKPKGEKVSVEAADTRTIVEKVAASGKVFPQKEIKISSDVSGEIVELFVEEGDSVVAGQILAKIDPDAYVSQVERGQAQVNSSKASLANSRSQIDNLIAQKEQIEAQLINARDIHARNEKLKKDGIISDADFDASLSNLRALEANIRSSEAGINAARESARGAEFTVKSTEASLKEIQTSLRRTTIYAPASGVISKLDVEQGERVVGTIQMTGTEMMRIANLNAMEVRVDVSENDIPRVSIGDVVEIEVDAYIDRKFLGTVTQIANSSTNTGVTTSLTSDQVTNFEVRVNIEPNSYADLISPQKPYPFRPGMSASVEVNTHTKEGVVAVPIQAVTTREKEDAKDKNKRARTVSNDNEEEDFDYDDLMEVVFVVAGDSINMIQVKTGIQDDRYIEIVTGIEKGKEVIVAPYSAVSRKLEQGTKVQVVKEEDLYKNN